MRAELTKELLQGLLGQGLSITKIGKQLGYSYTYIHRKAEKYGLKSNYISFQEQKRFRTDTHKQCAKCSEVKELELFGKRKNGSPKSYCNKCSNKIINDPIKENKRILIEEFGGCCSKCGYDKNASALEFHHIESEHKDFHFGGGSLRNLDKIRKELEKCILVCANCHREIHHPEHSLIKTESDDVQ